MVGNLLLKLFTLLELVSGNGRHESGFGFVLGSRAEGQHCAQSWHETDKFHSVESLKSGLVSVDELGVLNVVDHGKAFHTVSDVLHGADGLRSGWTGGQHREFLVVTRKQELSSVGGVDERSSLGLDSDFSLRGLVTGLLHKSIVVDWQSGFHGFYKSTDLVLIF